MKDRVKREREREKKDRREREREMKDSVKRERGLEVGVVGGRLGGSVSQGLDNDFSHTHRWCDTAPPLRTGRKREREREMQR